MATNIILNQLLIFGILFFVGVLASKVGLITSEAKDSLARIIIDITLPFLILSTFANLEFNVSLIKNGLFVFVLALINLFFLYTLGSISSRIQRLHPLQSTVHTLHTMFGNIVFLGFPLFDALFPGGIGVYYAAMYQLASNTVTFTYGIYRLSSGTQKSGWKSLINVNTGALVMGIILLITGMVLPKPLLDAFNGLGKCTSPLSMVYIGALLAGLNIKSALNRISVYVVSINKLIIAPLLLGLLYAYLIKLVGFEVSKEAFFVLVMQAGMPCQTIVVVMSRRYGGDYELAASNLFVTTVLSVLTLPLLYILLDKILTIF